MKKIKEGDQFQLGNKVFTYRCEGEKIILIPSSKKVKEPKRPSLEEIQDFFVKKGQTKERGKEFYDYYTDLNWHDKNNEPVKNWRAKVLNVWLPKPKPEQTHQPPQMVR